MPQVLEKLVNKLESAGKSKSSAYAIATSSLQKRGILKRKSKAKRKGK